MASRNSLRIMRAARGRWPQILTQLKPELASVISKRPSHGPCIVHGGVDGLRCFDDFDETGGMVCNTCNSFPNGVKVAAWICGCSEQTARKKVLQALKSPSIRSLPVTSTEIIKKKAKPQLNRAAAQKIEEVIADLIPLTDRVAEPARMYFLKRGLSITDYRQYGDSLYFHPSLPYVDRVTGRSGYSAAIVAKIYRIPDWDNPVCLHRTFITEAGEKLTISSPKQLMTPIFKGATNGAAIQLGFPMRTLHIAEGIETALAVRQATKEAIWASVTAGGMKNLEVPHFVEKVVIWADKDKSGTGEKSAKELQRRLRKNNVDARIKVPPYEIPESQKSLDWLDVLNMKE